MAGCGRRYISLALAAALTAQPLASAGARPLSRAEYEACQVRDEASFRGAVESITAKALRRELETVDYASIVAIEWRRLKLDALIDARVDQAVSDVREETSWGSLLQSLASQEQAQKLATAVAERVYQSEEMRKAIETLAVGVGRHVGGRVELASEDATTPALACLKAFVGPRYGSMISSAVTTDAGSGLDLTDSTAGPGVGTSDVLKKSTSGIAGVTLLIVRRQMANMARRIGQRIAGSVLSRLVSVVAGGVGVVLIAKDVWDLRHGVLPIIAEEMKSKTTKDKVREEVARSISQHIDDHLADISRGTAEQIVSVWQQFRRAHNKALDLADRNSPFRAFLDDVKPENLAQLDEVVSLVLEKDGESGVLKRLGDGTLDTAINRLPSEALTIARETRSIDDAIQWHAIAGGRLDDVLTYELHRRSKPDAFTQSSLLRLLALDDALAIGRLASLEKAPRDTLFAMQPAELKRLAQRLTQAELKILASYLTGLNEAPRTQVLAAVSEDPGRMIALKSEAVRDAVMASGDQEAAVAMMLRQGSGSVSQIADDFELAWNGRIKPRLLVAKHPVVLITAGLVFVLILLFLRRLLWPRGRTGGNTATS